MIAQIYSPLKGNGWLREKLRLARSSAEPLTAAVGFSILAYRLSPLECEQCIKRLSIPKSIARMLSDTIRLRDNLAILDQPQLSPSSIFQLLRDYPPTSVQTCALASDSSRIAQRLHLHLNKLRHVKTFLDGESLQQMGVPKGQGIGEILRAIHYAKLDGKVMTREEEEALAERLISQYKNG